MFILETKALKARQSGLERNYKVLGIIKPFSSISLLKKHIEKSCLKKANFSKPVNRLCTGIRQETNKEEGHLLQTIKSRRGG